jgi:hypothetical protein
MISRWYPVNPHGPATGIRAIGLVATKEFAKLSTHGRPSYVFDVQIIADIQMNSP